MTKNFFYAKIFFVKRKEIIAGLLRTVMDFLAVFIAWHLTYIVRPITDLIPYVQTYFPEEALPQMNFFLPFSISTAIFLVILFFLLSFYKFSENFDASKEFFRILFGVFLWGMLIVSYFSLVRHEAFFSRVMLLQAMTFSVIFIFILRVLLRWVFVLAWKNNAYARKVLLVGSGDVFESLQECLPQKMPFKLVDAWAEKELTNEYKLSRKNLDEIWYASNDFSMENMKKARILAEKNHLNFRFVPSELSLQFTSMEVDIIEGVPVLNPVLSALGGWERVFKRFFDIIFSLFFIVLFSPFLLLMAVMIKIDSRGPVFYKSQRVGRKGKIFNVLKFRSMVMNADKLKKQLENLSHRDGPLFKIKNDPRITHMGRFLRRFSLDELPQLFNVLRGDMSLTGPRPHLPEEIKKFTVQQARVLEVRPGITGLAQVSGRSDLPFEKEIELDLYFIQNWNILMEIKIIFKTVWVILEGKGAD